MANGVRFAWFNCVNPMFYNRVLNMCKNLGWPERFASYVMTCIAFETGYQFKASIRNKLSNAVGLIQFMPKTALSLGTTSDALSRMTELDQLEYVERYFKQYKNKIKGLDDMYMSILYPKYIAADGDTAVFTSPSVAYFQNSGLDGDKDGVITKSDICKKIQLCYDKGMSDRNSKLLIGHDDASG